MGIPFVSFYVMKALLAAYKPLILLDFHRSFNDTLTMMNPDYVKTVDGKWFNLTEYRENGWIQNYSLLQYYEMFEKDEG